MRKSSTYRLGKKRKVDLEYVKECMLVSAEVAKKALELVIDENKKYRLKKEDSETVRKRKLVKKYKLDDVNWVSITPGTTTIPLVVSKEKFVNAIAILENDDDEPPVKKNKANIVRACCRKHQRSKQEHESWDTAAHIIRCIKHSVSIHDWDSLTHLLLLLAENNRMYLPFVKEMTFFNILMNKSDYNSEVLENFLQTSFTRVADKKPSEFDVRYMDGEPKDEF